MRQEKRIGDTRGFCSRSEYPISGYEIHIGVSEGADTARPFLRREHGTHSVLESDVLDGAISTDGQIEGTYLHGLFNNDDFRRWWLESLKPGTSSDLNFNNYVDLQLDTLADELEAALDIDALLNDACPATLPIQNS